MKSSRGAVSGGRVRDRRNNPEGFSRKGFGGGSGSGMQSIPGTVRGFSVFSVA